jgi:hypothetical protein
MLVHKLMGAKSTVPPVGVSFITSIDAGNTQNFTSSTITIGSEKTNRLVVIAGTTTRSTTSGDPPLFSSATIGGVSANITNPANARAHTTCYAYRYVPTGTTTTFSISYNRAILGIVYHVYVFENVQSITPTDTQSIALASTVSVTTQEVTLTTVPGSGVLAGASTGTAAASTCTWSSPLSLGSTNVPSSRLRSTGFGVAVDPTTLAKYTLNTSADGPGIHAISWR